VCPYRDVCGRTIGCTGCAYALPGNRCTNGFRREKREPPRADGSRFAAGSHLCRLVPWGYLPLKSVGVFFFVSVKSEVQQIPLLLISWTVTVGSFAKNWSALKTRGIGMLAPFALI